MDVVQEALDRLAGKAITDSDGKRAVEFQVITAAVIGGTALSGGKGTIFGSILGVIVMAMLTNVLNLLGVSMYWQNVFVGTILIAVVAFDAATTPKEARQ